MDRSSALHSRATSALPGGMSSVMRQFDPPLYITRAQGASLWDESGRQYTDFHAAVGPIVLGHCHPEVRREVEESLRTVDLTGIGANEDEIALAEMLRVYVPSAEQVLFCTTGTEATFNAIRLCRVVTGRRLVVKFGASYHGHHDYTALATQGSGAAADGPLSAGISDQSMRESVVLAYNDTDAFAAFMSETGDQVAAVIVEPILHTPGCIEPLPGFLEALRAECTAHGSVLIFDEIVSGIRHGLGGYQQVAGVTPDLTTLSKALANGYPIAAIVGRRDLMSQFATAGGATFFGGTFNGLPMSARAARATLGVLARDDGAAYRHLFRLGERIRDGLRAIWTAEGIPAQVQGFGSVFVTYFTDRPVSYLSDLKDQDGERFIGFHTEMIKRGFFLVPVNLKRGNVMLSHTDQDVDRFLDAAADAASTLARRG